MDKDTDSFITAVSWLPQFGSCSLFATWLLSLSLTSLPSILIPPPGSLPSFVPSVLPFILHHCLLSSPPPSGHFPEHVASTVALWSSLWGRCCVLSFFVCECRNLRPILLWWWHHPACCRHVYLIPILATSHELMCPSDSPDFSSVSFPGWYVPQSPQKTQSF